MRIDERLRKFLLMRGHPVGVEFSEREVRESVRLMLESTRNDEARRNINEDLLLMVIEHLGEKEG